MTHALRNRLLIAVAIAAALVVPMMLGGGAAFAATLELSWQGYAALLAAILASWLSRTFKLHLLLHRLHLPVSVGHTLGISLATDFAFIATPGGIGGYVATVYYLRRAGASTSGAALITAVDQGLDLTFFAFALPIAALTLAWSGLPDNQIAIAFGAGALIVTIALVVLLARKKIAAWLVEPNALTRRWPWLLKHQTALRTMFSNVRTHSQLLLEGNWAFRCGILAATSLQWFSRYGVLWLALVLLGQHVPFALTLLVQAFVLHAAQWTGVPAGGGSAELGLTAVLANWAPAAKVATALLLWRAATFYVCLAAGAVAIALLARRGHHDSTPAQQGASA